MNTNNVKINANDEIVVQYLEQLWKGSIEEKAEEKAEEKVDDNPIIQLQIIPSENGEMQVEIVVGNNNSIPKRNAFNSEIKDKLHALRDVGFRVYQNIGLEKEVNLEPKTVTQNDINKVYDYKVGSNLSRKQLMTNISKCTVFPKHKSGPNTDPSNFRYLVNHHNTIKILDRLWVLDVIEKCGNNIPDQNIYKANLVKNFSPNIIYTAIENTKSIDDIVLLDVMKAFDSIEWDILEELLTSNLTRKTNTITAASLVNHYMVILKNRCLYYNNKIIKVSKGISTGLPSSSLVFTLVIEEIIYRWLNKMNYMNNREFKLTVYVDDMYLKILDHSIKEMIVYSLIDFLVEYKLYVNKKKSKADKKLKLTEIMNELKETDYYLGIPFTRNIKLYSELILKEFQAKMPNITWNKIYDILNNDDYTEECSKVFGFMNYKLRPIMNLKEDDTVNKMILCKFIKTKFYTMNLWECFVNSITGWMQIFL